MSLGAAPVIECHDVTYEYSRGAPPALQSVTLTVTHGESVCLMGPSGSGKSTLLAVLGGVVRPTAGTLRWSSPREGATKPGSDAFSWVMQTSNLLPRAHARENAALEAIIKGMPSGKALVKSAAVLAELGLAEFLRTPVRKLSGGQAQRVAVARSIVAASPVILADEPTGQLDSVSTAQVMDALLATTMTGTTLILASHDPAVAERCSRVLVMMDGELCADR